MSRKKRSQFPVILIGLLLVMILMLLVWFGVPFMAQKQLGQPVNYLTGFDRWNFSFQVLLGKKNLTTPVANTAEEMEFSISSGESVSSVANRLESVGLIHNAAAFRAYLVYKGLDSQIKAGTFSLSPSSSSLEIADSIQSTYTESVPFYIYPGWRAEEIAAALPTSGIEVDPDDFLRIVHNPSRLAGKTSFADYPSLDGFLFPGEYVINRKVNAKELVMIFLDNFTEQVPPDVYTAIEAQGLSLYEGITLASIIQRETFKDEERARMASVFYNRLSDGIKLETDPTVQYALGYSSEWGNWWKTPLKTNDLKVNSPYNTYNVFGLPPTPIANPGLPSILAVAYPEDTPYYYFRAMCDDSGYHDFSVTFEEHLSKECK
jgi:UPF0755 protein